MDLINSAHPDEGNVVTECDVANWSDGDQFFEDMVLLLIFPLLLNNVDFDVIKRSVINKFIQLPRSRF